jgi:hypothetical protein
MAIKDWKKTKVDQWRELWEKGDEWIHLDKRILNDSYDKDKYEVGSSKIINKETMSGHFKFFKSRSSAMNFVNKFLREN